MQAGSSNKTVGQKTPLKRTHSQTFDQKWPTEDTEVTIADVMEAVKELQSVIEEIISLIDLEDMYGPQETMGDSDEDLL